MKRNLLHFIVDAISALVMFGLIATGLVMRFVLPPGSGQWRSLWGWGRHDWGDAHFWLAAATGVVLIVHVALHWQWVCGTVLRLCGRWPGAPGQASRWRRNLAGFGFIALLVALLAGFVRFARHQVVTTDGNRERLRRGQQTGFTSSAPADHDDLIRGSMTLAEVVNAHHISPEQLRERLRLPANVPPGERLGRLGQQYGFTLSEVRAAVRAQASGVEP